MSRLPLPRFSLPGLELARFRRATITRLALLAIVIVPLVYGGLYLSANHDPVANLADLRAAVVDADAPVTVDPVGGGRPQTVDAGADLVDTLTGPGAEAGFSWETASEADAAQGLADGTYAAVLRIPEGFSAALASTAGDDPQQARLTVTTDDAENYVLGQVANTIATTIRTDVANSATTDYLGNVYVAFGSIHDSLGRAADGADELSTGARQADDGADSLVVGLGDLDSGAAQLVDGTGALRSGAADLATGTGRVADGAATAATGAQDLATGLDRLRTATGQLPTRTTQLAQGAEAVAAGAGQVSQATTTLADAADRLAPALDAAATLTPTVDALLQQTRALAAANPDDATLAAAVTRLEQVRRGLGDGSLAGAATTVRQQVDALAAGAAQVSTGAAQVSTGARQLADAAPELTRGVASAADGADRLATGTQSLSTGSRAAADGASRLSSGTAQVDDGAVSLLGGASQAQAGASELADGTGRLADGAGSLATRLREGQGEVPTYAGDDATRRADVVASPVDAERVRDHEVASYGDGLAPLFVPVALWVGGMVTYMVLRAVSQRALASTASSVRVAVAGWLPGVLLGTVQAVVLVGVLVLAVGISAPHPVATAAFAVLVAVVFTALHQGLVALLGGAGRLVALVLLVLQLTSAGGTYPVGTSPAFFEAIHPYLPMTYATDGLRHLISGAQAGPVWLDAAVLAAFGLLGLAVTVLACHRRRTWSVATLHPSLSL